MRMVDYRQFQAAATANAAAIRESGVAAETTGRSMERATKRGFLMNQMLFTVRRLAYGATLAFGAASLGAIGWGLQFNATMEQNQVAFEYFLGSAGAATQQLDKLYNLAALTPFEFPNLVDASRKFLAFGFTVDQSNSLLTALGDTVAGLGIGAEGIDRAVLALGQMKAAGRVLGGEIRQLTELGIPALMILQEQLGLTNDQIARIGELRIPADVAIAALVRGMQQRFEGMAERQAKTVRGQLSTLRDYTAQALGTITEPLFMRLRNTILPMAVKVAKAVTEGFKAGGMPEAIRRVDEVVGANGRLISAYDRVSSAASDFWIVLRKAVLPALGDTAQIVGVVLVPFLLLAVQALHLMAQNTTLTSAAIQIFIYWLVISKTATMLAALWEFRLAKAKAWNLFWTNMNTRALKVYIFMQGLAAAATLFLTEATVALTLALLANPITAIIIAVLALALAFGILYWKVEAFRNAVNATVTWILEHWSLVGPVVAGALGPLGQLLSVVMRVKAAFQTAYHWAKKLKDIKATDFIPGLGFDVTPGFDIPFLASGGTATVGGLAVIGERGPELMRIPAGATISPLSQNAPLDLASSFGSVIKELRIRVPVYIDKRQVAEANARATLEAEARR